MCILLLDGMFCMYIKSLYTNVFFEFCIALLIFFNFKKYFIYLLERERASAQARGEAEGQADFPLS